MSVINTNYLSLVAQNNLQKSQSALGTAIERLSSGLRINSAKDDAAGQAIANRMTSQITGLNQAQRNANDGISVAQTAEGALNQVNDNLQRVRELTVQAANSTNSPDDLKSIQGEIDERLNEINRISEQTDFNGVKVLGETKGLKIQVGANDGEEITVELKKINAAELSLDNFRVTGLDTPNTAATKDGLVADGYVRTAGANGTFVLTKTESVANAAATAGDVVSRLADTNSVAYTGTDTGLGVAADGNNYVYNAASESFTFNAANAAAASVTTYLDGQAAAGNNKITVTIGGAGKSVEATIDGSNLKTSDGQTLYLDGSGNLTTNNSGGGAAVATTTNLATAIAGVAGSTIELGGTKFTGDGTTIDVTGATITAAAFTPLGSAGGFTGGGYTVAAGGAVTLTSTGAAVNVNVAEDKLTTEANTVKETTYYEQANGAITDGQGARLYVDGGGAYTFEAVTDGAATNDPLAKLDEALKEVDTLRSSLGAIQNRFESAITNLQTNSTNLQAARSRIEDADYAVEVANMSKNQILQQAGTSVLAQANQIPQGVLSLLR